MTSKWTIWLALAGLSASWAWQGCSPAPFTEAPERTVTRTKPAEPTVPPSPALDQVALEHVVTVPTFTHTPSPSFSYDGRFLVFRSVERKRRRGERESAKVHALELRSMEDRLVHEYKFKDQHAAHDPYGYGAVDYTVSGYDHTFHATVLADNSVVMGMSSLGNPYDPYSTAARKVSLDGGRATDWGQEGAHPAVAPDGKRVLLQNANRMIEVSVSGQQIETWTGFFGVYSPDGKNILAQLTPYFAYDPGWVNAPWPDNLERPTGNPGGLFMIKEDGEFIPLTQKGGLPTWHPNGKRFAFEQPVVEEYRSGPIEIALYDLESGEVTRVAPEGRDPDFHPSGELLVFEGPGPSIRLTDLENIVDTGVKGQNPEFSPDGQYVMVEVPASSGKNSWKDVAVYRVSAGEGPAAGSTQQEPGESAEP